jgi:hypothetical protein
LEFLEEERYWDEFCPRISVLSATLIAPPAPHSYLIMLPVNTPHSLVIKERRHISKELTNTFRIGISQGKMPSGGFKDKGDDKSRRLFKKRVYLWGMK